MRKIIWVVILSLALIVPAQSVWSQDYTPSKKAMSKAHKKLEEIEAKNSRVRAFFAKNPNAREAFALIGELIFTREELMNNKQAAFAKEIGKKSEWEKASSGWDRY